MAKLTYINNMSLDGYIEVSRVAGSQWDEPEVT
jgi:hypothetical protein